MIRRVLVAAGLALLVLLVPDAASAAPSPVPLPSGASHAVAGSWRCEVTPADAAATPAVPEGRDCAVTSWATLAPLPNPLPVQEVSPVPAAPGGSGDTTSLRQDVADSHYGVMLALGVIVLLLAAQLPSSVFGAR